jgi:C4-type Zn-finger protein
MVHREEQDMVVGAEVEQGGAQQGPCTQVEGLLRFHIAKVLGTLFALGWRESGQINER